VVKIDKEAPGVLVSPAMISLIKTGVNKPNQIIAVWKIA
jgi:hypothetical protein